MCKEAFLDRGGVAGILPGFTHGKITLIQHPQMTLARLASSVWDLLYIVSLPRFTEVSWHMASGTQSSQCFMLHGKYQYHHFTDGEIEAGGFGG